MALHQAAGLATSDPVYRRGVKYLLQGQLADGTWHVGCELVKPLSDSQLQQII